MNVQLWTHTTASHTSTACGLTKRTSWWNWKRFRDSEMQNNYLKSSNLTVIIKKKICNGNGWLVGFFLHMDLNIAVIIRFLVCACTRNKPLSQFWATWFCYLENSERKMGYFSRQPANPRYWQSSTLWAGTAPAKWCIGITNMAAASSLWSDEDTEFSLPLMKEWEKASQCYLSL